MFEAIPFNATLNKEETMKIREVHIQYKRPRGADPTIRSPKQVAKLIRKLLPDNSREHFIAIYLDGAHQPISYRIVSTGLQNSSQVHAREVFQPAFMVGAISLIVAHNHPSGQLTPSSQDRSVTNTLMDAGKLLGITVLDHVIVSDLGHYSITEDCEYLDQKQAA